MRRLGVPWLLYTIITGNPVGVDSCTSTLNNTNPCPNEPNHQPEHNSLQVRRSTGR